MIETDKQIAQEWQYKAMKLQSQVDEWKLANNPRIKEINDLMSERDELRNELSETTEEAKREISNLRAQMDTTRAECAYTLNEMQAQLDNANADGALMRRALESALAGVWDGHYSGKGVEFGYAQSVDEEVKFALSTHAGRDLLARYREAVELLGMVRQDPSDPKIIVTEGITYAEWCKRRDTLLATVKGGSL